jgi:uncharacterized protein with HEPN domain
LTKKPQFENSFRHRRENLRALGNRLRHEHHPIREDRLWDIVQSDLPALASACEEALRRAGYGA